MKDLVDVSVLDIMLWDSANMKPDGFFDAGMLLQALKARGEGLDETKPTSVRRREIGKKLRLSEY